MLEIAGRPIHRRYRNYTWIVPGLKKYPDMSAAEMVFNDPAYFYWLIENGRVPYCASHQFALVGARMKHILPNREYPKRWLFKVTFEDGEFSNFKHVKISTNAELKKNQFLTPHLDVSMMAGASKEASGRMKEILNKRFLGGGQRIFAADCRAFLLNDANFDLTCRERHRLV